MTVMSIMSSILRVMHMCRTNVGKMTISRTRVSEQIYSEFYMCQRQTSCSMPNPWGNNIAAALCLNASTNAPSETFLCVTRG